MGTGVWQISRTYHCYKPLSPQRGRSAASTGAHLPALRLYLPPCLRCPCALAGRVSFLPVFPRSLSWSLGCPFSSAAGDNCCLRPCGVNPAGLRLVYTLASPLHFLNRLILLQQVSGVNSEGHECAEVLTESLARSGS